MGDQAQICVQVTGVSWDEYPLLRPAPDRIREINPRLLLRADVTSTHIVRKLDSPNEVASAIHDIGVVLEWLRLNLVAPVSPDSDGIDVEGLDDVPHFLPVNWYWDRQSLFTGTPNGAGQREFPLWPIADVKVVRRLAQCFDAWCRRDAYLDAAIDKFTEALFAESFTKSIAWSIASMDALIGLREDQRMAPIKRAIPQLVERDARRREYVNNVLAACFDIRAGEFHAESPAETYEKLVTTGTRSGRNAELLARETLRTAARAIVEFQKRLEGGRSPAQIINGLLRPG